MIKKFLILLGILVTISSCTKETRGVTVTGKVNGLKKGTLYLQAINDSTLINLDSVVVDGDPTFVLKAPLKEPQLLYLHLDKVDRAIYDDRIAFFAEPGEMTLNTSLKNFESQVAITGSINQQVFEEYKEMAKKFNDQNLDLIQTSFKVRKNENTDSIALVDKQIQQLLKRKYMYTVNYAITHKDVEIAPYLALSEIFDANVVFLDTIYNSLDKEIQHSRYGEILKEHIANRKALETKNE